MERVYVYKHIVFGLIEHGAHGPALELLKRDNHISKDELNKSLVLACQREYTLIVKRLITLGANVNYRDINGNTPLLVSVQNGASDIVWFLLINRADVNASNYVGDSALILSIRSSGSTETTEILLRQPEINIDHQNQDGYTAIMKAAEVKNVDILKILLNKYFNVDHISTSATLCVPTDECKTHEHTSNTVCNYCSQWTTLGKTVNCKGENVHEIAERCGFGSVFQLLQEHVSTKISLLELAVKANDIQSFQIFLDCKFVCAPEKMMLLDKVFLQLFQTCGDKAIIHFNENEIAMIKALLEHGVDVNTTGLRHTSVFDGERIRSNRFERSCTHQWSLYYETQIDPMLIAAKGGCVQVLELLLSFKASVNRLYFRHSPLHIALSHGQIECAEFLIQHGANMDCKQALRFAVYQQVPEYVRFLIASYRNELMTHFKTTSEIKDILLSSARLGNLEILGEILDLGANINGVMCPDLFPLAHSKNEEVAKFLIDRGASVNHAYKEAFNNTALITVLFGKDICDNSVVEVIQVLLENGASVSDTSWCEKTALMLAAVKEGSRRVLQLLLNHGAKLSETDIVGNTALMHAACIGCSQNVSFILQFIQGRKQLLNVQTAFGFTALMYAIMIRNKSIIGQLIDQGADVNIKNSNGDTALHLLFRSGKHEDEILRSLIQAGCDVNCQNNAGISPLMLAAKNCLRDTISVLLDSGAEINAVSKNTTMTALTHFLQRPYRDNSYFSCFEYLIKRGASLSYVGETVFLRLIIADQIHVVLKLIKYGYGPASNTQVSMSSLIDVSQIIFAYSPLFTALWVGNSALARLFFENLVLNYSDVSLLGHSKLVRKHLERKNYKECLDVLSEISAQPMTLFQLSFVVVSTAVGTIHGREIRVNELQLPQNIKEKLLFKSLDVLLSVP